MFNFSALIHIDDPPSNTDSSLTSSRPSFSASIHTVRDGPVLVHSSTLADPPSDLTLLCSSMSIAPFVHPRASRPSTSHAKSRAIVSKGWQKGKKLRVIRRLPVYGHHSSLLHTRQPGDYAFTTPVAPSHEGAQSSPNAISASSVVYFNRVATSRSSSHSGMSTLLPSGPNPSRHLGGGTPPCASPCAPSTFDIDDFLLFSTHVDGFDTCLFMSDHAVP